MAPVVLQHNRLIGMLGLPIALFALGGLFFIALINILSPWIFDSNIPNPLKLPAWGQVLVGALMALFVGGLIRDFWQSRHAYFHKLTLDDRGIHVESRSAPSLFVPWSTVAKVENRYPFVIRLSVVDHPQSIYVINDGWFGESRSFREAKDLIRRLAANLEPAK